ncbi:MAG: CoA pyrophosphatase [Anaerolineaceae bacterium]|nr:CoA pyrophosphatase [Anaerolineaceae bacterium]
MECWFSPPKTISDENIRRVLRLVPSSPGQHILEPGVDLPPEMQFREAAVLVPLACLDGSWHLVYTVRTDFVQDHKGQVAFPGGATESEDVDRAATALREAWEEIGILPAHVQILGYLDNLTTISGYLITPVVGVIPWPYCFRASPDEVKRVFTIPLQWLADSSHREERAFVGATTGLPRKAIFFSDYEGETLWGITARITVILLEVLQRGISLTRSG